MLLLYLDFSFVLIIFSWASDFLIIYFCWVHWFCIGVCLRVFAVFCSVFGLLVFNAGGPERLEGSLWSSWKFLLDGVKIINWILRVA